MKVFIVLLCILLGGCSVATVSNKGCTAQYLSLFKSSSAISMNVCGAKGGSTGSESDEILAEIATRLIKGN